ncbi:MAG: hypothetical protein ACE5GF_03655, partial [Thermodesulfobacteriota bacterium]
VATFISTFALIIAGAALVSALYPLLPDLVVTKLLPMIWISLILIGFAATYKSAYSDKVRPIFCGAVALAVAVYLLVSHGW